MGEWLAEWRESFLEASDRARVDQRPVPRADHAVTSSRSSARIALGQIRPSDVTRVLLTMERAGLAASTRRNTYAAMRAALDDAVADGLLAVNPVLRVRRPKATHQEAPSLSPDEAKRLLRGADGLRYANVLRLILGTGLRRGEALALRWSDLRLDRSEASITGSLVRRGGELVVAETKSQRSRRTVSLSPAMVRLLSEQRARQAAERLRAGNWWEETGFVFATEFGRPADPRNLLRATFLAAQKAELGSVSVHTLRHTYATTALLQGVPIHVVSRNLGHSSIAITADIYGHLTDEAAQSAALLVSEALELVTRRMRRPRPW